MVLLDQEYKYYQQNIINECTLYASFIFHKTFEDKYDWN